MDKSILIGCDLHDKNLLLKVALPDGQVLTRHYGTRPASKRHMLDWIKRQAVQHGAQRIALAYEASGSGFVFHDEMVSAGLECYVLAPSKLQRSPAQRQRKCDERDAQDLLERLQLHVVTGAKLPTVWVPPMQTREDRELVRMRLTVGEQLTRLKTQVSWLLKRQGVTELGESGWTREHWARLEALAGGELAAGAAMALDSLLRQIRAVQQELDILDGQVGQVAHEARYAPVVGRLLEHRGVGVLTAMVWLTELGDLRRFANRRQIGSYLGLTPSSHESGQSRDRKGHITRQGSARVRKMLCQAVWSRIRWDPADRAAYAALVERNPKKKKIAVVAMMRRLAVRLWHASVEAQQAMAAEVA